MKVARLRLLQADKPGYRGGGVIDCDASMAAAHPSGSAATCRGRRVAPMSGPR